MSGLLNRVLLSGESHRAELSRRARERASEFSWERFAQIALQTLEEAATR